MFSKGSESELSGSETATGVSTSAPTAKAAGMPSIISVDLKVIGDLHCAGDIQIEGAVEGDIKSQTVTVGEGAQVSGSIFGDTVRVSGNVTGQIEAKSVTLAKTAEVTGDVVHETLSIEAGAHLEGMCRRIQAVGKKAAGDSKVSGLKGARADTSAAAASLASGKASENGAEKPAAN